MKSKLSIIIPCYNCQETLTEAVDSCFTQGLDDFEIVMVDDGSKDATRILMNTLAQKYPEIRLIFHEKNRGGGAARNTGIAAASGELIYCLDSDNFFAPGTLPHMMDYLVEKSADGVAFYERRFFAKSNARDYSPQYNTVLDRPIVLSDLFTSPNILLDNFLFTKQSFLRTKGFPEHHGFDTQGFEMRYLSAQDGKNAVYICPDTIFYHRHMGKNQSYFEREYNAGNFSLNYYLCIEDIFSLFSNKAQEAIIAYDIFKKTSLGDNIFVTLKALHSQGGLFRDTQEKETEELASFDQALKAYRSGDFAKASSELETCSKRGLSGEVLYYNVLRASRGMAGTDPRLIEKETAAMVKKLQVEPGALYKIYHRNRFLSACASFIRKWKTKK
jgi:glycosyltransferase involved in cell wall biosynthesis